MARQEKKTRARGLPPKLFLRQKDAKTGSLPSIGRIASDNRTGTFGVFFDDLGTLNFVSNSTHVPGVGVDQTVLTSKFFQEFGTDLSSSQSIGSISGRSMSGIADTFVSFTPGQKLEPFRDHENPAVDGQSNNQEFFTTGSLPSVVGEGFDQPLWSKSKIEIDLTPSVSHSFGIQNFLSTSNNYPMAYWNNTTKRYDGVGSGDEFNLDKYKLPNTQSLKNYLEDKAFGFQGSMIGLDSDGFNIKGASQFFAPISNFGFPNHPKFEADSDHFIDISDYIDRPFLLEKIVVMFSASINYNQYPGGLAHNFVLSSATTFFLLNERNQLVPKSRLFAEATADRQYITAPQTISYLSRSFGPGTWFTGSFITGSAENTKVRDLVTWAQVAHLNLPALGFLEDDETTWLRELNITNPSILDWSGRFVMSGTVKSPLAYTNGITQLVNDSTGSVTTPEYINQWPVNGRNLYGDAGRNFLNVLETTRFSTTGTVPSSFAPDLPGQTSLITQSVNLAYSRTNPYLFQPGDRLIIGWEVPYHHHDQNVSNIDRLGANVGWYDGLGPQLTFAKAPAKLILYGSQIKKGKEHHDTLNQLLTTDGVHEVVVE